MKHLILAIKAYFSMASWSGFLENISILLGNGVY